MDASFASVATSEREVRAMGHLAYMPNYIVCDLCASRPKSGIGVVTMFPTGTFAPRKCDRFTFKKSARDAIAAAAPVCDVAVA
jgi:hypothetical protein